MVALAYTLSPEADASGESVGKQEDRPTMPDVTTLQPIDPLKVFLEFNEEYQVYVAQCLQTGHLVTADEPDMAKEMITELLEEEVSRAVQANDLSRLLSHPAPMALFFKWDIASQVPSAMDETRTIRIPGGVPRELRVLVGQDYRNVEVETEIKIATGTIARAA